MNKKLEKFSKNVSNLAREFFIMYPTDIIFLTFLEYCKICSGYAEWKKPLVGKVALFVSTLL